jgi:hypothetical protein
MGISYLTSIIWLAVLLLSEAAGPILLLLETTDLALLYLETTDASSSPFNSLGSTLLLLEITD